MHQEVLDNRAMSKDSFRQPYTVDEQMKFIDNLAGSVENANAAGDHEERLFCCLRPRNIGVTYLNVIVVFYYFFNS